MPPCIDVYARLEQVDQGSIEDFLGRYLGDWRRPEAWMWADAYNAARGVFGPVRSGLTAYSRRVAGEHCYVMIAFPRDGGIVLGLSIDEHPDGQAAHAAAGRLLEQLMEASGAAEGFAAVEEPPPLSAEEWSDAMARATVVPQGRTATGPTPSG